MTNLPGGRGVTGLPVRRLTAADLPACSALAVDRDWEPTPDRWRLLYELGEIFGIDDPDGGGLAGAVALTRYGPGLASIGKMLVAKRHGRQGLGGRLMRHAMEQAGRHGHLPAGHRRTGGRCTSGWGSGPSTGRCGTSARSRRVSRTRRRPRQPAPRAVSAADLPGIAELDRRRSGPIAARC